MDVATYILSHPNRGTGKGSVITNCSTHNQRIEHLWRDVYTSVLSLYHSLFHHLEDCGVLDPLKSVDLFALHFVFIPRINRHIDIWTEGWNAYMWQLITASTIYGGVAKHTWYGHNNCIRVI